MIYSQFIVVLLCYGIMCVIQTGGKLKDKKIQNLRKLLGLNRRGENYSFRYFFRYFPNWCLNNCDGEYCLTAWSKICFICKI